MNEALVNKHAPVMLDEVIASLAPRDGGRYLDGTFGGGGYTRAILERAQCTLWAIDRDPEAIERGASLLARFPGRLHLLHGQFGDMVTLLDEAGVTALDGIVLDLGVSSFQIDDPQRGFSFRHDGPLDMRMGKHGTSAADLVNTLPERSLADLFYELGEERASRRIAHAIVAARLAAPIETTGRLAGIIRSVLPPDRSGNHPATRSFQALRIKVNDELSQVEAALEQAVALLSPGGRLVVVAFHSLEDRIVKRFMTLAAGRAGSPSRHDPAGLKTRRAPNFRLLTARAVRPSAAETNRNPRSRSARLRALERLAMGCGHMIRPLTVATFLLACGSGLYLYQSKHEVQLLDRTIEKTVHETGALREQSRLLSAEWTMLNDPERLRQFSDTYLNLRTINPAQFTSLADLDNKLPAQRTEVPPPGADEAPASVELSATVHARTSAVRRPG